MNKIRGFFANLKRSTKITLVSCGCFVAMTALILGFFIVFPITPSEKVIASFGRESLIKKNDTSSVVTTAPADLSSVEIEQGTVTRAVVTTARSNRRKTSSSFSDQVTTGDGFYSGGYILTGAYPYENYYSGETTGTTVSPEAGGYENGYTEEPGGQTGAETPGGETGAETPGGVTTPEVPGGETGAETPGGETGGENPGGQTGAENPGGETGGQTGGETPGGQTPPENPGGNSEVSQW